MCIVIVMFLLISTFAFFDPMFSLQVVANMRGTDAEEVAERVKTQPSLSGLQVKFENSWGSQVLVPTQKCLSVYIQSISTDLNR